VQDPPVTDVERARDQIAAAVIQAEIVLESMRQAMRELGDAINGELTGAGVALPMHHTEYLGPTHP
jgi:hypothetical protein